MRCTPAWLVAWSFLVIGLLAPLVYVLAYPSREARDKSWKAFRDDPDWQKAYAKSKLDGPIVMKVDSKFLAPTDYSPIK